MGSEGGSSYLNSVATTFNSVIDIILPAFIGLAIIGFAYGIFLYVKSGAPSEKDKGRSIITWGGLAIVVLLSLYGITGLLQNIFGATGTIVTAPTTYKGSAPTPAPATADDMTGGMGIPTSP